MATGKWETSESGRLQQVRIPVEKPVAPKPAVKPSTDKKTAPTDSYEKRPTEEVRIPVTPIAQPIVSDPAIFLKNLKKSWDKCEDMRVANGYSKEEIGWAFYLAMKELFGKYK